MPTQSTRRPSKLPMNAVALLKQDHKKVKELLSQFENAHGAKRLELLDEIEAEVAVHMKIEEEIFYPAFKEAVHSHDDKQLFFEAEEEHHVTRGVIREIRTTNPESEQFEAKGKVIKDLIEHHVKEEEKEMFPKAKKAMGLAELRRLGQIMHDRKAALASEEERTTKVA